MIQSSDEDSKLKLRLKAQIKAQSSNEAKNLLNRFRNLFLNVEISFYALISFSSFEPGIPTVQNTN